LLNSATLMLLTAIIGIGLGIAAGALAAVRRDGIFDHTLSSICLAVTALPEYVVALILICSSRPTSRTSSRRCRSCNPAPHRGRTEGPRLPVATLTIAIFPYIFRMMRHR